MGNVIKVNWNQVLPPLTEEYWRDYVSDNTRTTFSNGIATMEWLKKNSYYNATIRVKEVNWKTTLNEKWYISYEINPSISDPYSVEMAGGYIPPQKQCESGQWTRIYGIGAALKTGNYYPVYLMNRRSSASSVTIGMTASCRNPIYINLTQMFGTGKEPNLEEFEAQCALNGIDLTQYQPYDAGTERDWLLPSYKIEMMERKKQMIIAAPHLKTVENGNTVDSSIIAHFHTTMGASINNLVITLPYNSVGYDNVVLTVAGINLLQCDTFTNGTPAGITYTETRNAQNEVISIKLSGTKQTSNSFRNLNYRSGSLAWPPDGQYSTYAYTQHAIIAFIGDYDTPKDVDGNSVADTIGKWKTYSLTHINSNPSEWVRIQLMPYGSTGQNIDTIVYPLVCLAQDTGCDFEPYKGQKYTTTFPTTIYGGSVNLISGELISRYAADGSEITPLAYQLTPQTIHTLRGVNNIWSDAGDVTVTYWTH